MPQPLGANEASIQHHLATKMAWLMGKSADLGSPSSGSSPTPSPTSSPSTSLGHITGKPQHHTLPHKPIGVTPGVNAAPNPAQAAPGDASQQQGYGVGVGMNPLVSAVRAGWQGISPGTSSPIPKMGADWASPIIRAINTVGTNVANPAAGFIGKMLGKGIGAAVYNRGGLRDIGSGLGTAAGYAKKAPGDILAALGLRHDATLEAMHKRNLLSDRLTAADRKGTDLVRNPWTQPSDQEAMELADPGGHMRKSPLFRNDVHREAMERMRDPMIVFNEDRGRRMASRGIIRDLDATIQDYPHAQERGGNWLRGLGVAGTLGAYGAHRGLSAYGHGKSC
jgi:hypothetical protein